VAFSGWMGEQRDMGMMVISGAYSVCQKSMSICLLGAKTDSEQGS